MNKLWMLIGCALLSWNVSALELAGIKLVDKVQIGNENLQLNGAGVRTKLFFKIYVGALYLPQKQTSAQAVIADGRGFRMALHMQRDLSSEKLFSAFSEAIVANHTADELVKLDASLKLMAKIFDTVKEVKSGDVITLDYLPDSGTHISVNGAAVGTIGGVAGFNQALLKIWLGNKPVQEDLKKGLLGG